MTPSKMKQIKVSAVKIKQAASSPASSASSTSAKKSKSRLKLSPVLKPIMTPPPTIEIVQGASSGRKKRSKKSDGNKSSTKKKWSVRAPTYIKTLRSSKDSNHELRKENEKLDALASFYSQDQDTENVNAFSSPSPKKSTINSPQSEYSQTRFPLSPIHNTGTPRAPRPGTGASAPLPVSSMTLGLKKLGVSKSVTAAHQAPADVDHCDSADLADPASDPSSSSAADDPADEVEESSVDKAVRELENLILIQTSLQNDEDDTSEKTGKSVENGREEEVLSQTASDTGDTASMPSLNLRYLPSASEDEEEYFNVDDFEAGGNESVSDDRGERKTPGHLKTMDTVSTLSAASTAFTFSTWSPSNSDYTDSIFSPASTAYAARTPGTASSAYTFGTANVSFFANTPRSVYNAETPHSTYTAHTAETNVSDQSNGTNGSEMTDPSMYSFGIKSFERTAQAEIDSLWEMLQGMKSMDEDEDEDDTDYDTDYQEGNMDCQESNDGDKKIWNLDVVNVDEPHAESVVTPYALGEGYVSFEGPQNFGAKSEEKEDSLSTENGERSDACIDPIEKRVEEEKEEKEDTAQCDMKGDNTVTGESENYNGKSRKSQPPKLVTTKRKYDLGLNLDTKEIKDVQAHAQTVDSTTSLQSTGFDNFISPAGSATCIFNPSPISYMSQDLSDDEDSDIQLKCISEVDAADENDVSASEKNVADADVSTRKNDAISDDSSDIFESLDHPSSAERSGQTEAETLETNKETYGTNDGVEVTCSGHENILQALPKIDPQMKMSVSDANEARDELSPLSQSQIEQSMSLTYSRSDLEGTEAVEIVGKDSGFYGTKTIAEEVPAATQGHEKSGNNVLDGESMPTAHDLNRGDSIEMSYTLSNDIGAMCEQQESVDHDFDTTNSTAVDACGNIEVTPLNEKENDEIPCLELVSEIKRDEDIGQSTNAPRLSLWPSTSSDFDSIAKLSTIIEIDSCSTSQSFPTSNSDTPLVSNLRKEVTMAPPTSVETCLVNSSTSDLDSKEQSHLADVSHACTESSQASCDPGITNEPPRGDSSADLAQRSDKDESSSSGKDPMSAKSQYETSPSEDAHKLYEAIVDDIRLSLSFADVAFAQAVEQLENQKKKSSALETKLDAAMVKDRLEKIESSEEGKPNGDEVQKPSLESREANSKQLDLLNKMKYLESLLKLKDTRLRAANEQLRLQSEITSKDLSESLVAQRQAALKAFEETAEEMGSFDGVEEVLTRARAELHLDDGKSCEESLNSSVHMPDTPVAKNGSLMKKISKIGRKMSGGGGDNDNFLPITDDEVASQLKEAIAEAETRAREKTKKEYEEEIMTLRRFLLNANSAINELQMKKQVTKSSKSNMFRKAKDFTKDELMLLSNKNKNAPKKKTKRHRQDNASSIFSDNSKEGELSKQQKLHVYELKGSPDTIDCSNIPCLGGDISPRIVRSTSSVTEKTRNTASHPHSSSNFVRNDLLIETPTLAKITEEKVDDGVNESFCAHDSLFAALKMFTCCEKKREPSNENFPGPKGSSVADTPSKSFARPGAEASFEPEKKSTKTVTHIFHSSTDQSVAVQSSGEEIEISLVC